jgi:hypothetical protein
MQQITYPKVETPERSLSGIFSIETGDLYDIVHLGEIKLGFISCDKLGNFYFTPTVAMENPFPSRSSYTSAMFDVFTLIANDLDLAIEFTIKVNHKKDTHYGLESK